ALEDDALLALPYNIIGRTKLFSAEFTKGIDYLQKGIPMMELEGNQEEVGWSKSMLALTLGWVGQFDEALPMLQHVLDMTRQAGNLIAESATLSRFGYAQLLRGDWQDAIRAFSQAIDISQRIGNQIVSGQANGALGYATFMSGSGQQGMANIKKGIMAVEAAQSYFGLSVLYAWLGEAYSIAGDSDQGRIAARKSLRIREFGERYGEVTAHRALTLAHAGKQEFNWSRVDFHMRESIRLAQERRERPSQAITHFRSAEILNQNGDLVAARDQIDQATSLFREMGMDWWTEQAEGLRGRIDSGQEFVWFAPYMDGPPTT
ncbi:MAG: tetratricopeptide repeat protein, partial [Lysobacterales bacterium]